MQSMVFFAHILGSSFDKSPRLQFKDLGIRGGANMLYKHGLKGSSTHAYQLDKRQLPKFFYCRLYSEVVCRTLDINPCVRVGVCQIRAPDSQVVLYSRILLTSGYDKVKSRVVERRTVSLPHLHMLQFSTSHPNSCPITESPVDAKLLGVGMVGEKK